VKPSDADLDLLIDAALTGLPAGAPHPRLALQVMAAVRDEPPPPVPFPWRRVALGIAQATAAAALVLLAPPEAAAWLPGAAAALPLTALAALPLLLGWADAV
jgi:hypothetical protein